MNITKEIGRNPRIDWIIVLTLSLIVAIILALFAVYLYKVVTKDNIDNVDITKVKTDNIFDSDTLSDTINLYSTKVEMSEKAKAGYSGLPDPSL